MARYSRNGQAGVDLPKAKLDRENLRQALELFRYLRPYRARFGGAMAALFASSLLSLAFPYLAGSMLPQFLRQTTILLGGVTLIAFTSLQLTGIASSSLPAGAWWNREPTKKCKRSRTAPTAVSPPCNFASEGERLHLQLAPFFAVRYLGGLADSGDS